MKKTNAPLMHPLKIANPVAVAKVVALLLHLLHAQSPKWGVTTPAHAATVVNLKSVVVSTCSVSFKAGFHGVGKVPNL